MTSIRRPEKQVVWLMAGGFISSFVIFLGLFTTGILDNRRLDLLEQRFTQHLQQEEEFQAFLSSPTVDAASQPELVALKEPPPKSDLGSRKFECQVGKASWYGPYDSYSGTSFHGKKTASGEIYDMYAMTAAHRTLPFGTIVEVERLKRKTHEPTGLKVTVRVNDRGPYIIYRNNAGKRIISSHPSRVIDLSKSAAEELDMMHEGVVTVRVCWPK